MRRRAAYFTPFYILRVLILSLALPSRSVFWFFCFVGKVDPVPQAVISKTVEVVSWVSENGRIIEMDGDLKNPYCPSERGERKK